MITVRDAVDHRADRSTSFNRHAEKVGMAACAQLVNCLNSLFLSPGDEFATTPVFNVFEMYAAHQGGTSVRTEFCVACKFVMTATARRPRSQG